MPSSSPRATVVRGRPPAHATSTELRRRPMTDGNGITGKVVAITGAGRGIGAATARLLAVRGARVVLGSRGEEDLAATADAIAANGGDVVYQATDITQPQQVSALVDLAT